MDAGTQEPDDGCDSEDGLDFARAALGVAGFVALAGVIGVVACRLFCAPCGS